MVLLRHANDQLLNLSLDPRPARAATSRGFSISRVRWAANGWNCSRRLRRASLGPPSCTARRRHPYAEIYIKPFKAAAVSLGVEAITAPVRDTSELETIIGAHARSPNGGLIAMPDAFMNTHRERIVLLAAHHRLPAVYAYRLNVEIGGLLSYRFDTHNNFRRAAMYVDRILKGEKPADLPVQAPTKLETVINLKTAKALGLEVPPTLLARADEVIE